MKKVTACLLALLLALTTICPALAMSEGELLYLAVLGDSISYGTGLHIGEKSYRTLVTEHFDGAMQVNYARDGNVYDDVLSSITRHRDTLAEANCYALSVGSNDYLEYVADNIFQISTPDRRFSLPYEDLLDFFSDVLVAHSSGMTDGILRFLHANRASRTDWTNDFCDILQSNLTDIIDQLHSCNADAQILLLNYYSPGDPYMDFVGKATALLDASNRDIRDAINLFDQMRTASVIQQVVLLTRIQTKLVNLSANIYLFVPLLKQFDLDLTILSPLLALIGIGFVGAEAFSQDRTILEKLGEVTELINGVDQLIDFTHDTLTQMNTMIKDLAKDDEMVIIIDVAEIGKSAETISSIDHFHPSADGQQIIANKMIAILETIYAGGEITPEPEPEETDWLTETIAFFREWLTKLFG